MTVYSIAHSQQVSKMLCVCFEKRSGFIGHSIIHVVFHLSKFLTFFLFLLVFLEFSMKLCCATCDRH